ncbi:DUF3995 domain-containing protein [Actinokineospora bangkokensis]|uniref:DUF3995 domain-containing protein n=1 Tax=Actinokineospora bangkokensis TaxID=1193682 RepID=A0A1Q9LPI9_9PSEU|nr:DUF3995 domain-containing protein [Actinokineospora bangkokensis]OLR93914.1 hypothetical protein BJP25_15570 [Actinokineospora bangkokensis]
MNAAGARQETGVRHQKTWAAWAAFAWAAVFAAVSAYWALGGTVGIDTVGGAIADLVHSGDSAASVLAWVAVLMKVAGMVYALALIQRWGRVFPRWLMLTGGWGATVLLIVYGGAIVVVGALVVTGVIEAAPTTDMYAIRWHLFLWDPYFVIWGVLLGIATAHYAKATRRG